METSVTGTDGIGHSIATGERVERPSTVDTSASAIWNGVWVGTYGWDFEVERMHRTGVLLSPQDAIKLAEALYVNAQAVLARSEDWNDEWL